MWRGEGGAWRQQHAADRLGRGVRRRDAGMVLGDGHGSGGMNGRLYELALFAGAEGGVVDNV